MNNVKSLLELRGTTSNKVSAFKNEISVQNEKFKKHLDSIANISFLYDYDDKFINISDMFEFSESNIWGQRVAVRDGYEDTFQDCYLTIDGFLYYNDYYYDIRILGKHNGKYLLYLESDGHCEFIYENNIDRYLPYNSFDLFYIFNDLYSYEKAFIKTELLENIDENF